jgi:aspartyl-tRNA(Asn)/glutamyl-tRNA(Gln) amidotransferase subunit C
MALTPLDVRRIAELARLDLGADEQARMLDQLNSFFRIVEQMSAVETSGV